MSSSKKQRKHHKDHRQQRKEGLSRVAHDPNGVRNIDRSDDNSSSRESENSDYTEDSGMSSSSDGSLSSLTGSSTSGSSSSDSSTSNSSSHSSSSSSFSDSHDDHEEHKSRSKRKRRDKTMAVTREIMLVTQGNDEGEMANPQESSQYSGGPTIEEEMNEPGTYSNKKMRYRQGQTYSSCHQNSKSDQKNKRKKKDRDESKKKKQRMVQDQQSLSHARYGHSGNRYTTRPGSSRQHQSNTKNESNTMSSAPKGKPTIASSSALTDLDKLTESTFLTFTISGTPHEMESLSKLSPNRKINLNLDNECAHLDSTTSPAMLERFNKNKDGGTNNMGLEGDQTYSKAPKGKGTTSENVASSSLSDKDIIRSVTLVKGQSTYPNSIEFDFPNLVVPGHLSSKTSKNDNKVSSSLSLGSETENSKKDSPMNQNKNGLSFTLDANEHVTVPREIANSNINTGVINYLRRFSSYTSSDSMKNGISHDVKGKVKIYHTDEQPHPIVQFYKDVMTRTPQQQQQPNGSSQTSSKAKRGAVSSMSINNNKGQKDAAKDSGLDTMKYGPGVTQSKDDPDYVLMDKSVAKKTLKRMSDHPSVSTKLDSLSDVSNPTAYITPLWNKGHAKKIIERELYKKNLANNKNDDNLDDKDLSDHNSTSPNDFGNTKSASSKKGSAKVMSSPMTFKSFSSTSGTNGNKGGFLTDTDKGTLKGQTDHSWIPYDTNDKANGGIKDQAHKATVTLLIKSVPAKRLQEIKNKNN